MSTEEKKTEDTVTKEVKDTGKAELIKRSVAVVMAENVNLIAENKKKDALIESMGTKLRDATDLIERGQKASYIAEAISMSSIPAEYLANMKLDDLIATVKTLKRATPLAFKSTAPFAGKEDSPTAKLDNVFKEYMEKVYK